MSIRYNLQEIDYGVISRLCEGHLRTYGKDSPNGVGWFNKDLFASRQLAMLGVILEEHKTNALRLLDVGCGTGELLTAINAAGLHNIDYVGCDLSAEMLDAAHSRWPENTFLAIDLLKDDSTHLRTFDYVVMSGVLTARCSLSHASMVVFAQAMLQKIFSICAVGIAFNTMSPYVDWQEESLFYWPVQDACAFLTHNCSRHIHMRMDYGGYENTYYVYRERTIHEPL